MEPHRLPPSGQGDYSSLSGTAIVSKTMDNIGHALNTDLDPDVYVLHI